MEMLFHISLASLNVVIALFLYAALSGEIGRLRADIERCARCHRRDR